MTTVNVLTTLEEVNEMFNDWLDDVKQGIHLSIELSQSNEEAEGLYKALHIIDELPYELGFVTK